MAAPRLPRVESARGPPGGCRACEPARHRGGRAVRGEDRRARSGASRTTTPGTPRPGAWRPRTRAEAPRSTRPRSAAASARSSPSPTRRRTRRDGSSRQWPSVPGPCRSRAGSTSWSPRSTSPFSWSSRDGRSDRPRPPRRDGEPDGRHLELHRRRAGDGRADGRALRGRRPRAASGSRSRTGVRTRSGPRRERAAAKSLMFNGHTDTSYSGREPWLQGRAGVPARGVRPRRAPLRARDLEHEGRARVLRRGGPGAARRGRPAARRRARRGRLRRDREDPVRRRAGRGVPGLRGRARGTSSRTAASPTCACSASRPRARSSSGHFGALWLRIRVHGGLHPHGLQRGEA